MKLKTDINSWRNRGNSAHGIHFEKVEIIEGLKNNQ